MEEFLTITEFIRNKLLNEYNSLKETFFDNTHTDENSLEDEETDLELDDIDEDDIDEITDDDFNSFLEDNEDNFEEQVILKLTNKINNSRYKNIIYLIILQDVYEFIKSKQIAELKLYEYEANMLEFLEIWDINNLFKKLKSSYDFHLDLITLYFEYHFENNIENRIKNRRLIELTNNQKELEKFKIYNIDNLQYQYTKRRF